MDRTGSSGISGFINPENSIWREMFQCGTSTMENSRRGNSIMSEPEKTTDDESLSSEDFIITIRKTEVFDYDITLNEHVNFPFKYEKIFATLRDLPHLTRSVTLHLANYGGYLDGLVPL